MAQTSVAESILTGTPTSSVPKRYETSRTQSGLPQLATGFIGVGTWMAVGYTLFAWNGMLNRFVATKPQVIIGMTLALAATVLLAHSEFIDMEGF